MLGVRERPPQKVICRACEGFAHWAKCLTCSKSFEVHIGSCRLVTLDHIGHTVVHNDLTPTILSIPSPESYEWADC